MTVITINMIIIILQMYVTGLEHLVVFSSKYKNCLDILILHGYSHITWSHGSGALH